jgi:thioredoxin-related protein
MKQIAFLFLAFIHLTAYNQDTTAYNQDTTAYNQDSIKIYNPLADASAELTAAIKQASEQNKHVLVQIGGNWCQWCIMLHGFFKSEQKIDSIINADYVLVRINFSPENRNYDVLARLDYPQRFGFPVLLILDENGKRLHTQDSWFLERGRGYDPEKVKRFLLIWNRTAVNPAEYVKK